jgi:hypothetical protein
MKQETKVRAARGRALWIRFVALYPISMNKPASWILHACAYGRLKSSAGARDWKQMVDCHVGQVRGYDREILGELAQLCEQVRHLAGPPRDDT